MCVHASRISNVTNHNQVSSIQHWAHRTAECEMSPLNSSSHSGARPDHWRGTYAAVPQSAVGSTRLPVYHAAPARSLLLLATADRTRFHNWPHWIVLNAECCVVRGFPAFFILRQVSAHALLVCSLWRWVVFGHGEKTSTGSQPICSCAVK